MARRLFFVFLLIFQIFSFSYAQNYEIDIPEEFELLDSDDDGKGFMLFNQSAKTFCVIRESAEYRSAEQALSAMIQKMGAKAAIKRIQWNHNDCAVTQSFAWVLNGEQKSGRATAIPERDGKNIIIVICFGDGSQLSKMMCDSIVDSVSVDRAGKFSPGIITALLYPQGEEKEIALEIGGKRILTAIDQNAENAEKYVISREFEIMKAFISSPKWKEAWIRYYNQIYRTAYFYLQRPAFDIATVIYQSDTQFSAAILNWLQYFDYERSENANDADFVPATTAIQTKHNDCDSRSIILAAILNQTAVPATVFVSRDYSHMIAGVNLKDAGFKIQGANKDFYLTAETTSKGLSLGRIPADIADRSKWIDIQIPR